MNTRIQEIRNLIAKALPEGSVLTEHNEHGHFYRIMLPDERGKIGNIYPSVTGKLQILKDESLINYKMNAAIRYFASEFHNMTDMNIMDHLDRAAKVTQDVLADAGDIGTQIHDCRQEIFTQWIGTGVKPGDFLSFIKPDQMDVRLKSGVRALSKFVEENDYTPIATELFVFNHKLKVAGTLDDLGMMRIDGKMRFVLMDLKSSNQFKDHYFFQVAIYYWMLFKLIGVRPEACMIVKLSKEDGTYKIEDLKRPAMLASYARSMIRTHDGISYIRNLRKDNQKKVAEKIEL